MLKAHVSGRVGVVFRSPSRGIIEHTMHMEFPTTNNDVEYEVVLVGIRFTLTLGEGVVKLLTNSRLVAH